MATIFDFQHTQTSYSILTNLSVDCPSPKTRVQMLEFHCNHEYELRYSLIIIYILLMAAIFDAQHTETSDSIPICLSVFPDPENMGLAVGIVFLSCLQGEICIHPVWRPPSWNSHFRFGRTAFLLIWLDNLIPKTQGKPLNCRFYLQWELRFRGVVTTLLGTSLFGRPIWTHEEQNLLKIFVPGDMEMNCREVYGSASEKTATKINGVWKNTWAPLHGNLRNFSMQFTLIGREAWAHHFSVLSFTLYQASFTN